MNWYVTSTSSDTVQTVDNWVNSTMYPGLSTQGEGIDLRQEMQWILYGSPTRSPKGHWVVYRRYDRTSPSSHYHFATKEGVHGPAYNYTDVLVRTRRVPLDSRGNPLTSLKPGLEQGDKYIYYFVYTFIPKIGDHIIEINWDNHALTPNIATVSLMDRYEIKRVHDYRLENGNIQYWITSVDYDEIRY